MGYDDIVNSLWQGWQGVKNDLYNIFCANKSFVVVILACLLFVFAVGKFNKKYKHR